MKKFTSFLFVLILSGSSYSQQLPNLPIPIGAGTCEVWNNSIYHFGGSDDWSGSICYPRIYKYDGTSWAYYDTIPDNNMWGVTSVLVGDNVYLLGAWPSGPSLNRRYDMNTRVWTYLAQSPNTIHTWGITAEVFNGLIYLFNPDGDCYAYDIAGDSWSNKTFNTASGTRDLSSILYQNEIYIIGWDDSTFYKYTPTSDQWTKLANSPYQVGACAMGIINNLIYFAGGNIGGATGAQYKSVLVYNITNNTWSIDALELSSRRHWMATAEYRGGLYVVGGIDSVAQAVDIVEEIVPQGTSGTDDEIIPPEAFTLLQNYPNPFNPSTSISYTIPVYSKVTLKIFDLLGKEIEMLIDEEKAAGRYEVTWNAADLPSGVYFYRLQAGSFAETKKMILMK